MQIEFISLSVKNIVKPKLTFLSYTLQSCTLKKTCKIFFVTFFFNGNLLDALVICQTVFTCEKTQISEGHSAVKKARGESQS